MKHRLFERILVGILLVVAAGIVVHAPLSVWLGTVWPHWAEVIKSWKELLMALALVLFIVIAAQRKMVTVLLNDRLMQLSLFFVGIHFLMIAAFDNGLHSAGAGILIDLRYVLYFVLVYGTLRLFPQYRKLFLQVFVGGAVVVIGFALLQLFVLPKDILTHIGYSKATIVPYLTVDQNPNYIRINSTLRGPNPLGAYAVIVLSFLVAYAVKHGRRLQYNQRLWLGILAAIAGLIVGTSYSRSSMIGLIVAIIVTLAAVATAKARKQLLTTMVIAIVVVGGLIFAFRDNSVISNVLLHDNPTGGSTVDSNAGHAESLVDGMKRFVVEPFGGGVGSTGSASIPTKAPLIIENQYLFVAHEAGWAGLIVFVWLFVEVMKRLWQRRAGVLALAVFASGCGLAVIGLLLPVWTDDTISIIWWGLAAVAVSSPLGGLYGTRKSH
ncbi:MAG: rane protein of unknown function [Candidatus Saccharibacteria bacterium]|nr:rane protein of unknown function [Candidatus Saccharibacteria bacterium]